MLALKFAWKEVVNQPRTTTVILITLVVGLISYVGLDLFRRSVESTLNDHSQKMLAADFVITARRPLTADEMEKVNSVVKRPAHLVTEMYSMVRTGSQSRLVQLKAIPPSFPHYGTLEVNGDSPLQKINEQKLVWVYPEILTQLNVQVGDTLSIGVSEFTIAGVIKNDFVNSWRGMTLAPKIYLGINMMPETQLIQKGSTVNYNYLYKINRGEKLETIAKILGQRLTDTSVRILTHVQAAEDYGRGLGVVADYLGLVTLVALFLTGVGINFIFSAHLSSKLKEVAILIALGFTKMRVVQIYFCYLLILVLFAWIPAWGAGLLLFPSLRKMSSQVLPLDVPIVFDHASFLMAGLIALLAIFTSCLMTILRIRRINPATLFDDSMSVPPLRKRTVFLSWVIIISVFSALAIYVSHSFKIGSLFILVLGFTALDFLVIGYFALRGFAAFSKRFSYPTKYVLLSLGRIKRPAILSLISVGVGCYLTVLVPQIREVLVSELSMPEGITLPEFFLFDIQEDQLPLLRETVQKVGGNLEEPSAMVRAKLDAVNGIPFEKVSDEASFSTREEETERRFRNRGFNLSFREKLSEAERIVEGSEFSGGSENEISVEERFAERLKLKVGDVLDFDIQGDRVTGKIVNLRTVRWTSFRPNFFILFSPGVLEKMPKTYLASIANLGEAQKAQMQNSIVEALPNISIVDVTRTVERVKGLIGLITWALNFMALLCLVQSFVILFAIFYQESLRRQNEWRLLKLLGSPSNKIVSMNVLQSFLLSFTASLVGILWAVIGSYVFMRYVFESTGRLNLLSPLVMLVVITLISVSMTYVIVSRFLSRKLEISL